MKNKFLLLVAALVLSTTATFAATQFNIPNSETMIQDNGSKSEDMLTAVRLYMEDRGFIVCYVTEELGTTNYLVKDSMGMWYRVYVVETSIIGWGEIDA